MELQREALRIKCLLMIGTNLARWRRGNCGYSFLMAIATTMILEGLFRQGIKKFKSRSGANGWGMMAAMVIMRCQIVVGI